MSKLLTLTLPTIILYSISANMDDMKNYLAVCGPGNPSLKHPYTTAHKVELCHIVSYAIITDVCTICSHAELSRELF